MDPSVYYSDYGDELDEAVEQGRRRRFVKRFVLFVVILALVGSGFFFTVHRYLSPIDPENASVDKKIGWLALRDLSKEPPETRKKLYDLYLGSVSVPDPENAEATIYELPEPAKKLSGVFLAGRDAEVAAWRARETRLNYLRIDYVVKRSDERAGSCVESRDVEPGPALIERWETRRKELAEGRPRKKTPTLERNIQLLMLEWFNAKSRAYDAAPDDKKRAKLEAIVADLENFQTFYNKVRVAGKLEELSLAGMLREFDLTADGWLELTTPEEIAKVLWFKDLLSAVVAQKMSGDLNAGFNVFEYPPRIPGKDEEARRAERREASRAKRSAKTVDALKKALEAAKTYAYGKSE